MNKEKTINDLIRDVVDFSKERDWEKYHNPRNLAMALSVEASELLELYLWCSDDGPQPAVESRNVKVAEEAADVAITLFNFCNSAGVDLSEAIKNKLIANGKRYPVDLVRGKMEKYDEY